MGAEEPWGLELLQMQPACLPWLSPWGGGTAQALPDPFSRPEGAQNSSQGPKSGCSHRGTFLKIQLSKLLIHFQRFVKTPRGLRTCFCSSRRAPGTTSCLVTCRFPSNPKGGGETGGGRGTGTVWPEVRRGERGLVLWVQGRQRTKDQFSNSRRSSEGIQKIFSI